MFIVIVIVIVIVVRVVVISMRIDFIIVVLSLFCYWFVLKPTEKLSDALHPSKKKKTFHKVIKKILTGSKKHPEVAVQIATAGISFAMLISQQQTL